MRLVTEVPAFLNVQLSSHLLLDSTIHKLVLLVLRQHCLEQIDTAQLNFNNGSDHPPMKLCVVVAVEPSTLEMFQASTNTYNI